MNIETNFIEDVRALYGARLTALGYTLPDATGDARKDAHRILVDYWNAQVRRIPLRPRTVHWSNELRARVPTLSSALQASLQDVEQGCRAGVDLTPRLSRKLTKRKFNDKMLHDWGIHHLHLGDDLDEDGFIERTDDVLFVLRRPDDIYFLDVRPHGEWADDAFVEIVHDNWPGVIKAHRLDGLSGHMLSKEERETLRSKNMNAGVFTKDGTHYAALGGGLVSSGSNIKSIMWGDMTLGTAADLEALARGFDSEELADEIEEATGVRPTKLELKLGPVEVDHALIFVANAAKPFAIRVPIATEPAPIVRL